VSPPAVPVEDRMSRFVADAYAVGQSYYDLARNNAPAVEVPDTTAYVGPPIQELRRDHHADLDQQDATADADYACVGCGSASESDAAPSNDCEVDDPACVPDPPLPEDSGVPIEQHPADPLS